MNFTKGQRNSELMERLSHNLFLGITALQSGELDWSLDLFEGGLDLTKQFSEPEQVPSILKNTYAPQLYDLGRKLSRKGELSKAERALMHVAQIEYSIGNLDNQAAVLSDIGTMYLEHGIYERTLELYQKAVLIRKTLNNGVGEAEGYRKIALTYAKMDRPSEVYSMLIRSVQTAIDCGATEQATIGLTTAITLVEEHSAVSPDGLYRLYQQAVQIGDKDIIFTLQKSLQTQPLKNAPLQFKNEEVFISYSHTDNAIALRIIDQLNKIPVFNVYFDQSRLYPGDNWDEKLLDAVKLTDILVLLIGTDTMKRPYVQMEIEAFFTSHRSTVSRVIPVLLPGCTQLPAELSQYQWYDLRSDNNQPLRPMVQVIWDAVFTTTPEMKQMTPDFSRITTDVDDAQGSASIKEKIESGQSYLSPTDLVFALNYGVVRTNMTCSHKEMDMASFQTKNCEGQARVLCIGCVKGTCSEPFHVYERFCTLLPPHGPFEEGVKFFYWCPHCKGPVCSYCLGIQDDYPCAPEQVVDYPFKCPACRQSLQVVPVFQADFKKVSESIQRWAHAGGPIEA